MNEPVKKESPLPIARAVDEGVAPRALAPRSRRAALPIAMAAALVLAGGGAGVYAYAASAEAKAKVAGGDCPMRTHAGEGVLARTVEKIVDVIHPSPPRRMAGEVSVPLPPPPPGSASVAIPPEDSPMRLGGAAPPVAPSDRPNTQALTPTPSTPTLAGTSSPIQPPAPKAIAPHPSEPKLGGKPVASPSDW